MCPRQLEKAATVLQDEIERRRISAASLFVARNDRIVRSRGFGQLRPEAGAPPAEADSIFLVASPTKPVTATTVMLLVERGEISLDDKVDQYIPEFRGGHRDKVTVRQLLSHTSGMPDMLPQNMELRRAHAPLSAFVEAAVRTPLLYEPGTDFGYQSMGTLLAAEIIERLTGKRLRDFEEEEIFAPLGMGRTCLGLGHHKISDLVWCGTSTEASDDGRLCGWNTEYWRDLGAPWGGMHTTAPDMAILLQTFVRGGEFSGVRLLAAGSVRAMVNDQNRQLPSPAPFGIGWALRDSKEASYFGELVSESTFGHVGATGTVAWADPERDLVCVILTNLMVDDGSLLRRVSNAVAAAVVE